LCGGVCVLGWGICMSWFLREGSVLEGRNGKISHMCVSAGPTNMCRLGIAPMTGQISLTELGFWAQGLWPY